MGAVVAAWLLAVVLAIGCAQSAWAELTAGEFEAQSIALLPDVTEDMTNPLYWSNKQKDPTAVQANRATIDALNKAGVDADGTMLQPLKDATERFYTQEEQLKLKEGAESDLAYFVSQKAEDVDGNILTEAEAAAIADNCPTDGSAPSIASGYAIVTRHTTMRNLPTDRMMGLTPGDADDDNLYLSMLRVNEPLLVRAQSVDGKFFLCISSCLSASWVPAEDIAICKDRAEWLAAWDIPAGNELVVTGYKVRTEQSRQTPNTADRMLYMGTVLERVDLDSPERALEIVGTRSAFNCHVCYLPVREADGTYSKELALIAQSADVSEGYLPLTKENIAKQAFKSLGQMYGWGGMLEANDCSGYVRDVYKCFGLELARNTTRQMNLPVRGYDLTGLDDVHKAAAIAQMPLGTVLFWGSHEMIYLGQENGKLYVISSLGSIGDVYGESIGSYQVKAVAINTLDMLRGNRNTWLTSLTYANVPFVPASQQGPGLTDISFYEGGVSWPGAKYAYTGKRIAPTVEIAGLVKGEDYDVAFKNNRKVGTASVTVTGKGSLAGSVTHTFKIAKASQTIEAKNVGRKAKASTKTGRLAKDRTYNLKAIAKVSAKTKVQFKKANNSAGKKITVDASSGKVTVKQGLKAGTYKVKVKLTANASASYKAAQAKHIMFKLVVV